VIDEYAGVVRARGFVGGVAVASTKCTGPIDLYL
jgi:hypothetical protein